MTSRDPAAWMARIALGEDSDLELKSVTWRGSGMVNQPHPDSLSDELAGMANSRGGCLVLGVDDQSRHVTGIPRDCLDQVESWLVSICTDRIKPPLFVETSHFELPDAEGRPQAVIAVHVPRSLWVHQSANGYFRRVGHSKRPLEPESLARLFQQRSQARLIRFEEQPVPGTSPADFDPLLAAKYLREGEGDAQTQLQRLHLVVPGDGGPQLSVAGVLLGTLRPTRWLPSAYIQAVAYRGSENDPAQQLDAKDFEGPLEQQVWDAFHFARLYNQVEADKDLGRADRPQYSQRAIFEALVNAVAHRDYSLSGGRIRLHLFGDRLELYSPGALPNSMSLESMTRLSLPRNELLASLFSRYAEVRESGLGREFLMDRRGAGVDIILRESQRLSGRLPVYTNLSDVDLLLTIYPAFPRSG